MAYLREIYIRKCYRCSGKATRTLHNHRNEEINAYCAKCAPRALKEFEAMERGERKTKEAV